MMSMMGRHGPFGAGPGMGGGMSGGLVNPGMGAAFSMMSQASTHMPGTDDASSDKMDRNGRRCHVEGREAGGRGAEERQVRSTELRSLVVGTVVRRRRGAWHRESGLRVTNAGVALRELRRILAANRLHGKQAGGLPIGVQCASRLGVAQHGTQRQVTGSRRFPPPAAYPRLLLHRSPVPRRIAAAASRHVSLRVERVAETAVGVSHVELGLTFSGSAAASARYTSRRLAARGRGIAGALDLER